jgi:hypothetical protein
MRPLKDKVWNKLVDAAWEIDEIYQSVDLKALTDRELLSLARKGVSLAEHLLDIDQLT